MPAAAAGCSFGTLQSLPDTHDNDDDDGHDSMKNFRQRGLVKLAELILAGVLLNSQQLPQRVRELINWTTDQLLNSDDVTT